MAQKRISVSATHLGDEKELFPQSYSLVKRGEKARYVNFHKELSKASVEEDVKAAYRKFFSLPQDSSKRQDLYTTQMLFEFKYDKNFASNHVKAEVLAQILYYVRNLKYNTNDKPVPPFLCLADVNETIITETINWENYYNSDLYDWDAAPSSPDTSLIHDLEISEMIRELHVFHTFDLSELVALDNTFSRIYSNDIDKGLIVKRDITERNFEDIYRSWSDKFAEAVRNGYKPSQYFICDIQEGKSFIREDIGRVSFDVEEGVSKTKKLNLREYKAFWELYNKNKSNKLDVLRGILSKADRLSDDFQRRFEGEFYTPINLAQKAINYLDAVIGGETKKIDWDSGKYRLWDMACGTGNLEYYLPSKAYKYCYLSTLRSEDIIFCKGIFHEANVFKYDYLNDDVDRVVGQDQTVRWEMPQQLVDDLSNPDINWIIYINPPFGTAQSNIDAPESKEGISMTKIRHHMTKNKLGESSRELTSQFLYRIHHEFKNKKAWLGMFSKIKFINANNDQVLRSSIFRYKYKRGFIFDARVFDGVKGEFPIGFLVWDLATWVEDFEEQIIIAEKCTKKGVTFDTKQINAINKKLLLNKWIVRPKTTKVFPPFSSALNINSDKKDLRNRISDGFLCSLCVKGDDLQNQRSVSLYSGPYGSAGAFSVTKDNFLRSMVTHAVRKIAKKDWSNDRDSFCIPYNRYFHDEVVNMIGYVEGETPEFPLGFAYDCVVWSLFSNSNNTVELKDVSYEGKEYQILNNLFPFTLAQVNKWGIKDPDISLTILAENEDRFAAKWVDEHQQKLSKAAIKVIEAAKKVYRTYFQNLHVLDTPKYMIKTWGAGRYQIIHSLEDAEIGIEEIKGLNDSLKALGDKIREQIHPLGFIR